MTFLGLFLVFILVLAYFRKKGTDMHKRNNDAFWQRENEANHVRRQDISKLPYIIIPFEKFPIGISAEEDILDYEADLQKLSTKKILNLGNQSNTDLKLKYGPANLPELTEYDQNFARLARTIVAYARCLIEHGYCTEAIPVLEFGIDCGSDISANYTLLAEIYHSNGNSAELSALIEKANSLDSLMKKPILEKLAVYQND